MTAETKILAFGGSLRAASWNYKILEVAAQAARRAGASVTCVHLRDLPMPLYSEELEREQGLPENARRLKQLMIEHDGLLIASPEYNSSVSGVLKNAIDWASRREGNEPGLAAFAGKTAALISASTGALGGLRGLVHLRAILGNMQVMVVPRQYAMPQADRQFDQNGQIIDHPVLEKIEACTGQLVDVCKKLYPANRNK